LLKVPGSDSRFNLSKEIVRMIAADKAIEDEQIVITMP